MLYFYLVASAALIPILDRFFNILRMPYSWYLVPLLFIAFFIGFIIIHAAVLFISLMCVDVNKPCNKQSPYYRALITSSLNLVFKLLRVHVHTCGKEKIPENERVLLVSNHIDNVDPAIYLHEFPDLQLGFIAKKEVYETMPIVAKVIHKLNGLPIDRDNDREGVKTIIKAIKTVKDDIASIGVFPEGYTSKTGELQPMRNGAFKVATKTGAKIVVCTVWDTRKVVKRLFFHRTDIYVNVAGVIDTKELPQTAEIGQKVFDMMNESLNEQKQKS
ncbi:MAG: 1-acyl-sn-glycerol-3-phosphate acyltransferase [Clostridia bacterium]|nr:1-acyl-sn-glycerol-3-phosphate acyltransferase [Clostridia bacterium]